MISSPHPNYNDNQCIYSDIRDVIIQISKSEDQSHAHKLRVGVGGTEPVSNVLGMSNNDERTFGCHVVHSSKPAIHTIKDVVQEGEENKKRPPFFENTDHREQSTYK